MCLRGTNPSLTQTPARQYGLANGDWFMLTRLAMASVAASAIRCCRLSWSAALSCAKSSEASLIRRRHGRLGRDIITRNHGVQQRR